MKRFIGGYQCWRVLPVAVNSKCSSLFMELACWDAITTRMMG